MLSYYLSLIETPQDSKFFTDLYAKYHDILLRIAYAMLSSQHMAEDAVHEAFIKIIEHYDQISKIPNNKLYAWIVTILKNTCLDMLRKSKRHSSQDAESALTSLPDFSQDVEADVRYRLILHAIRDLPADECELLELKLVMGWSDREIARVFHITPNAVAVRIHRLKQRLRDMLSEEGY